MKPKERQGRRGKRDDGGGGEEKAATTAAARGQQLVLGCILIIPQAAREPRPISLALSFYRSPPLRFFWFTQASGGAPPKREATKAEGTEDSPPLQPR